MKVKRVKGAKKILNFYKNSFGIFEPYQIILDLTFCHAALIGKVLIKEQLPKYLDGNVQLVTTKCVIEEGKALGSQLSGAVSIAKRFQVRLCGHKKNSVPAAECIKTMIGTDNPKRYFVATQDRELTEHLATIPGVPLLYLNSNCIVLEKATSLSSRVAQEIQESKVNPSAHEKQSLDKLKTSLPEEEKRMKRKRKVAKGPNPLSVKKKKRKLEESSSGSASKKKRVRKRKRGKVPGHVKQTVTTS